MIKSLKIKNYLYIEDITLNFSQGLNVIIGESGVGKSVLISVFSLLNGNKSLTKVVGSYSDKAVICIEFYHSFSSILKVLNQQNISEDFNKLEIEISAKTIYKINGGATPVSIIKKIFHFLLDIHSQNDYDLIYKNQISILTKFMSTDEYEVLKGYQTYYEEFQRIGEEVNKIQKQIFTDVDKDFYKYQLQELSEANLILEEEDELFKKIKFLKEKEKLSRIIEVIKNDFDIVLEKLQFMSSQVTKLIDVIPEDLISGFSNQVHGFEDLHWSMLKGCDEENFLEDHDMEQIDARLMKLESLKQKYNSSISELVLYKESLEKRFADQDILKMELNVLVLGQKEIEAKMIELADELSNIRKKVADKVILSLRNYLDLLKLNKAEIKSDFKVKAYSFDGKDSFQFLVKVNLGSDYYELPQLSGGETSRVLLAFKAALAPDSMIRTYIFDEIDSGVSGEIAEKMGQVLKTMSTKQQLIVITHLPNIAILGDEIYKLEKIFNNQNTLIKVQRLKKEAELISELSMMISSKNTKETIAYVESLVKGKKW